MIAGLLSKTPGSFMYSAHLGQPEGREEHIDVKGQSWQHCPATWKAMWEGIGKFEVDAPLSLDPVTTEQLRRLN
jgi:hypothetical protein